MSQRASMVRATSPMVCSVINTRTHHSEFAAMLLARVSAEQVQMWVGTNRGAFVVSR